MTRVLLVYQPIDGGVGRHVADLADGLAARGHQVVLCGPERPELTPVDFPHIPVPMSRAVTPAADARAVARLVTALDSFRPEVVHAHSSKAGAIARLARLRRGRTPVVYTPHGYAFTGQFERPLERFGYRAAELMLAPLTSMVLCVCEAEARLARGVAPGRPIRVVHNGVPMAPGRALGGPAPVGHTSAAGEPKPGPVICTLTQLRPGKGVEVLLDAFKRLRSSASPADARLVIWGDGSDADKLRARAHELGLGDAVQFPGATTTPLDAISQADLFVLPSLAEAFPYVVLEAMSAGLPIVASDVGGIAEAVQPPLCGLLVEPGDAGALATAIDGLLRDPARRVAVGAAGRSRIETDLSLDAMLDGVEHAYEELVHRGR